jgi:hypothetical protein
MPRVLIREGSSGILGLTGAGSPRFVPDCDLDKALALLFQLYELKAENGKTFRENYWHSGFNWLSSQVGWLFWRACYRFVQYAPFLEDCLFGQTRPIFVNSLNFERLYRLFKPKTRVSLRNALYYRLLLPAHNSRWAETAAAPLLFYRYGPKDFRTKDILAILEARGVGLSLVYSPSIKLYRHRQEQGHPVYFLYRPQSLQNPFGHSYDLSGLPRLTQAFFRSVTATAEHRMANALADYKRHLANLEKARPKLFFGLDDHNEVYSILYACKTLGIPSIGYQLGMYARLQAAYTLEGWEPGEYQWYDRVIVWGRYWEDVIRRHSRAYPPDYFLLGANKNSYDYRRLDSERFAAKNILIPYEFFANTHEIGRYIRAFIDAGWRVYFKLKPDERPERQLESYCLPEDYRRQLVPVTRITPELMAEVNVVAGAMTTLLYDLLPYGKETWVLDTEFRLLDDMVADGLARRVRLDDIPTLVPPPKADHRLDYSYIFNDAPLEKVVEEHVLSRL